VSFTAGRRIWKHVLRFDFFATLLSIHGLRCRPELAADDKTRARWNHLAQEKKEETSRNGAIYF